MPDNKQIDETLRYVKTSSPVDINQLSPDGRKLIQDARDIIETARLMVQEKNADELFQNFVWHTKDVDVSQAKKDPNEVLSVDKTKARDDGQTGMFFPHLVLSSETYRFVVFFFFFIVFYHLGLIVIGVYPAVKHLRTILSLVLTNSEVRKLLSDFSLIGRDLLARGASKAAEGLRPDPERLAHVNDSGPQDQFVTEGGRTARPGETPVLEGKVPGTGLSVSQHPKDDLGTGATVKAENGEVKSGQEVYEEGQDRASKLKEQGQSAAEEQIDEAQG